MDYQLKKCQQQSTEGVFTRTSTTTASKRTTEEETVNEFVKFLMCSNNNAHSVASDYVVKDPLFRRVDEHGVPSSLLEGEP
ncbi:hypothetical protein V2J09_014351 [Rumex salicifolius]